MCWAWLFLAILLEVAATVFLKLSDGFTKFAPTAVMAVLYLLSFLPMALALRGMDVGVAYAVWSAVGTSALAIIGMLLFKESVSVLKVVSIVLIVVGVISLNLSSRRETRDAAAKQIASSEDLKR